MTTFAERLNEALEAKDISAAELARALGVADGTISKYKSGAYEPKQRRLEKIANILNVSIAWLMGADVPMSKNSISCFNPMPKVNPVRRLGTISCGLPIDSEENFDGIDYAPDFVKCDFSLICEGDSMTGARINDGDVVYIRQQSVVDNGEIAAILIDGSEKLLKRVYMTDSSITLQAENPAYPPLVYVGEDMNRVSIIGKAVAFTSSI